MHITCEVLGKNIFLILLNYGLNFYFDCYHVIRDFFRLTVF